MCLCSSLRFEKKQKNLQQKRRQVQESPNRNHTHTHTYIPSHGSKQKNSEIAAKNTSV